MHIFQLVRTLGLFQLMRSSTIFQLMRTYAIFQLRTLGVFQLMRSSTIFQLMRTYAIFQLMRTMCIFQLMRTLCIFQLMRTVRSALCSALMLIPKHLKNEQVIRVKKNSWGCRPPHSNYLGVFLRLRRTFAKVITFVGASAHEF